jgi:hypothetical protein
VKIIASPSERLEEFEGTCEVVLCNKTYFVVREAYQRDKQSQNSSRRSSISAIDKNKYIGISVEIQLQYEANQSFD